MIHYLRYTCTDQWRRLAIPLQFPRSPAQMRIEVFYHVCHVIYHLREKKPSPKFTAKCEIFPTFFPTHPYENINAPWHWELQSGSAVTSKMVWTLSSASPWQRTSCLLTQCKKPSTEDGTGGWLWWDGTRARRWCYVWRQGDGGVSIVSDAFKTQTIMKRSRVPASSGRAQKRLYAKKPVVVYRKVTFTYVVPGW